MHDSRVLDAGKRMGFARDGEPDLLWTLVITSIQLRAKCGLWVTVRRASYAWDGWGCWGDVAGPGAWATT